jgi:4'-phosphopantetheinyl transferase
MSRAQPDRLAMPAPDEIWVWQASLHRASREPPSLTDGERRVAASIQGRRARACHVAGRTLLRRRLGRLLGCDPLSVEVVDGPDGKPALAEPVLSFNVSHAGDLVLIAVARPRRLGVDVEQIRPGRDLRAVIAEALGPADREAVARAVTRRGIRAFFRHWTRYEALVKARGDGLRLPLPELAEIAAGFHVRDLHVGPGYAAAVAADGKAWRVVRPPALDTASTASYRRPRCGPRSPGSPPPWSRCPFAS